MASNRIYRYQRGATMVEFTIVFMVFLILILAIIEFSLVIFDASRLAEATRAGARYAITNDPACNIFDRAGAYSDPIGCQPDEKLDCTTTPNDSVTIEITNCTATPDTPGCKLVQLMDQMMLRLDNSILAEGGKVRITYACSNTGDPSLPITVPEVTVEAIDVQHPMMFTAIFGFYSPGGNTIGPSITLPTFATTRTGEDMYNPPTP